MKTAESRRVAFTARDNILRRVAHMTNEEVISLDDVLDSDILKYWNNLTVEDVDKVVAFLKKRAEEE